MVNFLVYQLKNFGKSYKYVPCYVVYIAWIVILYAYKNASILSSYDSSFIVLTFISTWLTVTILKVDTISEKELHYIQLGSVTKYLMGKLVFSLLFLLPMILLAMIYPLLIDVYNKNIELIHIIFGLYSHLTGGLLGISIAFLITSTSLSNKKFSWLIGVLILLIALLKDVIGETSLVLRPLMWLLPPFYEINNLLIHGDNPKINHLTLFNVIYTYIYIIIFTIIIFISIKKSDLK
uniref:Uncharacterized protein n=1 Tax=Mammaliicoccus fleurettii TaxID=150056 RepID=D9N393_9STAP|nr:conserved hypothetical protein [Mammaliicoccus fleurettii]